MFLLIYFILAHSAKFENVSISGHTIAVGYYVFPFECPTVRPSVYKGIYMTEEYVLCQCMSGFVPIAT